MTSALPRTLATLGGAVLALGLLAGCGDDEPKAEPSPTPSSSAPATSPAASDGTDATDAPDPAEGGDPSAIPVYYAGKTPQGDRLYREFTQISGADRLVAAAASVTGGKPVDPDYRTLWPGGRFTSVTKTADAIVVEVPDASWLERGSLSAAQARLAVQQLVYTLQGTAGARLPVQVEQGGQPAATLLGVDAAKGLTAAPELDVLALVNITEPAEGTAVSGKITAEGRASSFEATVPWEIQDATGKVVQQGFATAEGWADKLYPWSTEVDVSKLAPGSYVFVARTDDPSDGEGGGPTEDTKRITVK